MTFPIRNVVAQAVKTIYQSKGYRSPAKSKDNTHTRVLDELKKAGKEPPVIDISFWTLADTIINFFRQLPQHPEYQSVLARIDGPEIQTCIEAAIDDEVTTLTFGYVVLMPHLYGKLNPAKQLPLDPHISEARIINPGEFMGTLNVAEAFFVKLIYVSRPDASNGTMFKVTDRSGNIAFIHDRVEKFQGKVKLGECFKIHATPARFTPAANGEKHTVLRNVRLIEDTIRPGKAPIPDDKNDNSIKKLFCNGSI